jgi:hypothetical protein
MLSLIEQLSTVKNVLFRIVEIGAALIGVILILYLLLGEDSNPYIDSVITNLSHLIEKISPQALVALALVVFGCIVIKSKR